MGDATFDFKNYLETGVVNRVPPRMVRTSYLWTVSDPSYAAVNGDDILPDFAIGRLPAATLPEAQAMVEKIVAYETDPGLKVAPVVLVFTERFELECTRSPLSPGFTPRDLRARP